MSYNTEEIIKASLDNVGALNKKLNDIETLHSHIRQSIAESSKIPGLFEKLGIDLSQSTENYLEGNNNIFKEKIAEFKNTTEELSKEILRLESISFEEHFNLLKDDFLKSTNEAFKKEMDKLDEKASKFQSQLNDLKQEISRLSKIDLEGHFEKHQNKLSEVFNAINSINATLTNMLQNTIKITQSIADVEQRIKANHNDFKIKIEKIEEVLTDQNEVLNTNFSKIDKTFNELKTQNSEIITVIESNNKKQQTLTYITWAIIIIAVITIIVLK